ncbi:hypothetical protein HDU96_001650 [Phlyctochytrium bullatum]|nr:hypothetical protein HDU96_001650 [Phlyctochytrium bullatum]
MHALSTILAIAAVAVTAANAWQARPPYRLHYAAPDTPGTSEPGYPEDASPEYPPERWQARPPYRLHYAVPMVPPVQQYSEGAAQYPSERWQARPPYRLHYAAPDGTEPQDQQYPEDGPQQDPAERWQVRPPYRLHYAAPDGTNGPQNQPGPDAAAPEDLSPNWQYRPPYRLLYAAPDATSTAPAVPTAEISAAPDTALTTKPACALRFQEAAVACKAAGAGWEGCVRVAWRERGRCFEAVEAGREAGVGEAEGNKEEGPVGSDV